MTGWRLIIGDPRGCQAACERGPAVDVLARPLPQTSSTRHRREDDHPRGPRSAGRAPRPRPGSSGSAPGGVRNRSISMTLRQPARRRAVAGGGGCESGRNRGSELELGDRACSRARWQAMRQEGSWYGGLPAARRTQRTRPDGEKGVGDEPLILPRSGSEADHRPWRRVELGVELESPDMVPRSCSPSLEPLEGLPSGGRLGSHLSGNRSPRPNRARSAAGRRRFRYPASRRSLQARREGRIEVYSRSGGP